MAPLCIDGGSVENVSITKLVTTEAMVIISFISFALCDLLTYCTPIFLIIVRN